MNTDVSPTPQTVHPHSEIAENNGKFREIKKLYLASGSPRRRELIARIGLPFEIVPSPPDEYASSSAPELIAKEIAVNKAKGAVELRNRKLLPGEALITADTSVWVDGQMLGKPRDREDAFRMLRLISGRAHDVITGVAVVIPSVPGANENKPDIRSFAAVTKVFVAGLDDTEIERYISSGDPMDKAGAYGIQGDFSTFIDKIEGDYFNVVGLPLSALYRELKAIDASAQAGTAENKS